MAARARIPRVAPYKPGTGQTPKQFLQGLGGTLTNKGGTWSLARPPAPAAPAAAPASGPAAPALFPPDAGYVGQINSLTQARDTTLAGITAERARGLNAYGFTENAAGQPIYDPNNPFSKATLLKQSYDRARAQSRQSMGSQGQLYSGALQNQQDFANRNQLQSEDALQRSLIDFLARNASQVTSAKDAYERGEAQAMADLASRSADNPLYTPVTSGAPAAPAPAPMAPRAPTAAAPKVIKVRRQPTTVAKRKRRR